MASWRIADLDQAVVRGLIGRIKLGLLDGAPAPATGPSKINIPEHRALALTAAEQTMVLLKNDGILPLAGQTAENCRGRAARGFAPRAARQLHRP